MDLRTLQQFRVIGEIGNMSRAARELHVAQPSLSLMVSRLEKDLGLLLLERSKKGVKLTAAGQHFINYCNEALRNWDQVRAELHHLTSEVSGTVRLGLHPSVAIYTLPFFLPQLMAEYPVLRVELVHDLSRRLLDKIVEQEVEVGLIINPEPRPNLVIRHLFEDEVTVFRRPVTVNDDLLIYDSNLSQIQAVRRQMEIEGIRFERTLESSNLEVISQMVLHGLGHAILPKRVLQSFNAPFAESFPKRLKPVRDHLALVYRSEFRRTAKGKVFVQAIRKALES